MVLHPASFVQPFFGQVIQKFLPSNCLVEMITKILRFEGTILGSHPLEFRGSFTKVALVLYVITKKISSRMHVENQFPSIVDCLAWKFLTIAP